MIKLEDFDFDNTLINENSHENILIYDISYKTFIGPRPLRIRFGKTDGFIRIYDGSKYLVLLGSEKYDSIYNGIKRITIKIQSKLILMILYLQKKIELPIKHKLPIKSVLNKDKNHYYYKIFLEKCTYQLTEK